MFDQDCYEGEDAVDAIMGELDLLARVMVDHEITLVELAPDAALVQRVRLLTSWQLRLRPAFEHVVRELVAQFEAAEAG